MSNALPADLPLDGRGLRFALVATRWNGHIVEQLLAGAQAALRAKDAEVSSVYRCAGAFELAPLAARVARKGGIDGIIALGCLIRGGTDHYTLLAQETTRALGALALEGGLNPRPLAVAFGVLTCESEDQAQERADVRRGNKGGEAALSCIEQVRALKAVGD
jgi:6,7-dimethyl-8-ribityllumazine synthase